MPAGWRITVQSGAVERTFVAAMPDEDLAKVEVLLRAGGGFFVEVTGISDGDMQSLGAAAGQVLEVAQGPARTRWTAL